MLLKNSLKNAYQKYLIAESWIEACRHPLQIVKTVRNPDSKVLAICYKPDQYRFMGVRNATLRTFDNVWQISTIYNENQASELAEQIIYSGFNRIILNGFTLKIARIIEHLKRKSEFDVDVIHYGSLAQILEYSWAEEEFDQLLRFAREGKVRKIGFAKQGMAEVVRGLGYQAEFILSWCPDPIKNSYSRKRTPGIDLGMFSTKRFRKNYYTQLMAARMISDARVHVMHSPGQPELLRPFHGRIVNHGFLGPDEFLCLLRQMDLNLYVSLSECWPGVVVESIAQGVPCITSHTHEIFQYDQYLFKKLVVSALDNPLAISEKIRSVLDEREEIAQRCYEYAKRLNEIARETIRKFLED
jgi:glycosyltransferase involved in cell wall biosynthesis